MFSAAGFDATTVVDIAAAAGVSVQTVFNHFASKEELFFDARAEWVDGPATAVRDRAPGTPVTTALRRHLVASVEGFARAYSDPHHRRMMDVLLSTPALLTYERNLHEETVAKLAAELAAAFDAGDHASTPVWAEIMASVWMAAVRTVVVDLRSATETIDAAAAQAAVELVDRVLRDLEELSFSPVSAPTARAG
jgi:AcrR family transcriptional regulator